MTESLFRRILWLYIALTIASIASCFFPNYSDELEEAYMAEPETWLASNFWLMGSLAAIVLIAWLVSLVGLFQFKWWARSVALYSTIMSLIMYPFLGASVYSGLDNALTEASNIIWGMLLALSYFSSVSTRFIR